MIFSYKAVDADGRIISGTRDVADKAAMLSYLKSQGLTPISVKEGSTNFGDIMIGGKPKAKQLAMFCEQFAALLKAGVSVLSALRMLADQQKKGILKNGILTAASSVAAGESLAVGMSKTTKAFDPTFIALVKAGEASGSLEVSFDRMGEQYRKDAEISATIKKAMVYPIIVIIVSIAVVIFMLLKIVPSFTEIFDTLEMEMPAITEWVVGISNWLKEHWLIFFGTIAGIYIAITIFNRSETGKKTKSWLALHAPGIKKLVVKTNASKLSRTLATLTASGMSVVEALYILKDTLPNYYAKEAVQDIIEKVLVGEPMSKGIEAHPEVFPPMLVQMVSVGEDTGDLTSMLTRTADYYDLEVRTAISMLMSMIEPVLILILAAIVVVIVLSVLAPLIKLYSDLGDSLNGTGSYSY